MIIEGDSNLKLKTHDGIYLIRLDDILYFKAERAYSQLIQTDEHSILICKQLCVIQRVLKNHDFVRIHKSFLINKTASLISKVKTEAYTSRIICYRFQEEKHPQSTRNYWNMVLKMEGINTVYKIF